jgi:hypothetical protein
VIKKLIQLVTIVIMINGKSIGLNLFKERRDYMGHQKVGGFNSSLSLRFLSFIPFSSPFNVVEDDRFQKLFFFFIFLVPTSLSPELGGDLGNFGNKEAGLRVEIFFPIPRRRRKSTASRSTNWASYGTPLERLSSTRGVGS